MQVADTPTNFHRPSTSRSTKLAKALGPPNSPKESGSSLVMSIRYLGLFIILPTKFYPDPSTLKCFPRFSISPSNSLQCHRIRSGFKIRAPRHGVLLNIKFVKIRQPVRKLKLPHFYLIFPPSFHSPPDGRIGEATISNLIWSGPRYACQLSAIAILIMYLVSDLLHVKIGVVRDSNLRPFAP